MQKNFTSTELLSRLIPLLIGYLEALFSAASTDTDLFAYGEKTAYIECLEWLQTWEYASLFGLDFDIEERFPL